MATVFNILAIVVMFAVVVLIRPITMMRRLRQHLQQADGARVCCSSWRWC